MSSWDRSPPPDPSRRPLRLRLPMDDAVIGPIADGIVGSVKACIAEAWLSAIALAVALVIGLSSCFSARCSGTRPLHLLAAVELRRPGGLLVDQDVTLRGVPIGKVSKLSIVPDGVNAEVRLDSSTHVRSRPEGPGGRPLGGGRAIIDFDSRATAKAVPGRRQRAKEQRDIPVTLGELLGHSDGMLKQIDTPRRWRSSSWRMSKEGPEKVRDIMDSGACRISTFDG